MSIREIAGKLGRSPSGVHKVVKALRPQTPQATDRPQGVRKTLQAEVSARDDDTMRRLIELRDILYDDLLISGPNTKPRLSSEYRSVLKEIHELEAREGSGKESKLDAIFKRFNERKSST